MFLPLAQNHQETARDPSWPPQNGLPTQQLSSNEGEVMGVGLRRIVMPNVRPGCYSEPLLSAGLAYFWLNKTRGGDEPKKNLMAFPFEYKCHLTPDVSKHLKIFQVLQKKDTTRPR